MAELSQFQLSDFSSHPQVRGSTSKYGNWVLGIGGGVWGCIHGAASHSHSRLLMLHPPPRSLSVLQPLPLLLALQPAQLQPFALLHPKLHPELHPPLPLQQNKIISKSKQFIITSWVSL